MWARRQSRASHLANDVALAHRTTGSHPPDEPAEVCVYCLDPAIVAQPDEPSKVATDAERNNGPICDGMHWRFSSDGNIDTAMHVWLPVQGMAAAPEV